MLYFYPQNVSINVTELHSTQTEAYSIIPRSWFMDFRMYTVDTTQISLGQTSFFCQKNPYFIRVSALYLWLFDCLQSGVIVSHIYVSVFWFIFLGRDSVSLIWHCYFGICSHRAYLRTVGLWKLKTQLQLCVSSDVLLYVFVSHPDLERKRSEATLMCTSQSVMRRLDSVWSHAGVNKQLLLWFCFASHRS